MKRTEAIEECIAKERDFATQTLAIQQLGEFKAILANLLNAATKAHEALVLTQEDARVKEELPQTILLRKAIKEASK